MKKTCAVLQDIYKEQDPDVLVDNYCRALKEMAGDRWLRFPSDWLHQQVLMKSAQQNGKAIEGPGESNLLSCIALALHLHLHCTCNSEFFGRMCSVVCFWQHLSGTHCCFRCSLCFLFPVIDDRHQAKDLAQVYKDVVRDTIVIDGKDHVCQTGDVVIQSLFGQIYEAFQKRHCLGKCV